MACLSALGYGYHQYRDIILYDNSHHYPLALFFVTSGSKALAAITVCRESGSTRFSSMYWQLILSFHSPFVKKFGSQTGVTSNKHVVHRTSEFCESSEPTGSDYNSITINTSIFILIQDTVTCVITQHMLISVFLLGVAT